MNKARAAFLVPTVLAALASQAARAQPRSVSLPFALDHNRLTVEAEFVRPDGTVRKARAWMDTGSESLVVAESLARDLGLDLSGLKTAQPQHSVDLAGPAPRMLVGGLPLDLEGSRMRVHPGTHLRPGVAAEANLPANALRRLHIVLDYPALRLIVARPGAIQPRGVAVPCRVNAETGLFQVAVTLDGETFQLGIDNGSAGTWVSDTLTTVWQARHPAWPRSTGAVGSTNFFGFPFEAAGVLMRLPELRIGTLPALEVGLLGLPQELFDWYSKKSAGAVVGFVGANVLKAFRVEVDFPGQMTYWEAGPAPEPSDLDIVGLTLRPEVDGRFTIVGIASQAGKPTVEGIQPGDTLIRVDALDASGAAMGAVAEALRGQPGTARRLVVERDGTQLTVDARVTRFP